MKHLVQYVSVIALGLSSLAFTGAAQADRGFTAYSNHGYAHRSYPFNHYYQHQKPYWQNRSCALPPRHYQEPLHDRYSWRGHDRDYGHKSWRRDHDRRSYTHDYPRRFQPGYARINRD